MFVSYVCLKLAAYELSIWFAVLWFRMSLWGQTMRNISLLAAKAMSIEICAQPDFWLISSHPKQHMDIQGIKIPPNWKS